MWIEDGNKLLFLLVQVRLYKVVLLQIENSIFDLCRRQLTRTLVNTQGSASRLVWY